MQTSDDETINQSVEEMQKKLGEIQEVEKSKEGVKGIQKAAEKVKELKRLNEEQSRLVSQYINSSEKARGYITKEKARYAPTYLSVLQQSYSAALDASKGKGDITTAFTGLIDTLSQRSQGLETSDKESKKKPVVVKKDEVKQKQVESPETRLKAIGFSMGSFRNQSLVNGKKHLPLGTTDSTVITTSTITEFILSLVDESARTDKTPSDYYLRHDIQNLKDTRVYYNYQIQLGGSGFVYKSTDTSMTNVILDSNVVRYYFGLDALERDALAYSLAGILRIAHTESLSREATIIITFDNGDAQTFIQAHSPKDK